MGDQTNEWGESLLFRPAFCHLESRVGSGGGSGAFISASPCHASPREGVAFGPLLAWMGLGGVLATPQVLDLCPGCRGNWVSFL